MISHTKPNITMVQFDKPEPLDTYDDKFGTYDICPKSAYWICNEHSAINLFVKENDYFPKWPQRDHNTIWYRILNRNELI